MALQKWLESLDISDCEQVIQQLGLLGITKLEHFTDFDTVEDLKTLSLEKSEKRRFLRGLSSFCSSSTEDFISRNSDHVSNIGTEHDGETTTENSLDIVLQGPHSEEYQVTNHESSLKPEPTVGNQDSHIQYNKKEESFFHRAMNFGGFSGYLPNVGRNPTESVENTGSLSELSETGDTKTSELRSNLKYADLPVVGALVGGIVACPIACLISTKFGGFGTAAGIGSVAGFASGVMIEENIADADEANANKVIERDLIDLNDDITSDASIQDNPTVAHETTLITDTGGAMPDDNEDNLDKDSEKKYDEVTYESGDDIRTESLQIQTEFQNYLATDHGNEMTIEEGYTSPQNKDDIADNSRHSSNEYDEPFLEAGLIQLHQIDDLQAEGEDSPEELF